MPEKWRVHYRDAGRNPRTDKQAEMQRFFCKQQSAATHSMRENNRGQRAAARSRSKAARTEASGRFNDRSLGKKKRKDAKFHSNADEKPAAKKLVNGRISDDTKCPVHPKSNHTWGQCVFIPNRRSDDDGGKKPAAKPKKTNGKRKGKGKDDADAHCMQVNEPLDWDNTDDDCLAMNDDDDQEIESVDGHMALAKAEQGMEDLSLDDPVPKKRKSVSDDVAGKFIAFVSLNIPHHFDSFTLSQESSGYSHTPDEVELLYVQHNDEKYSNGVIENNSGPVSFDDSLCLRATSHAVVKTMQRAKVDRLFRVLFDSGCDKTMLKRSVLPPGVNPSLGRRRQVTGVASTLIMNKEVMMEDLFFTEFSATKRVPGPIRAIVMEHDAAPYDLIIGMDVMQKLGIEIHNTIKTIVWDSQHIPFKPHDYFLSGWFSQNLQHTLVDAAAAADFEDDADPLEDLGYESKTIKSSLYEKHDPKIVAEQQTHLSPSQRQDLAKVLSQFPKLFSGILGCYPHQKVHLDLKANAKLYRCRPYPVPKQHEKVFKEELDRLEEIGVLSRCGASEWLSPSFIIPKKDG
jgi:hypothetical protein